MFDFSVRRATIHACTFALCMSVWYRVRVCAECTFKKRKRKGNEIQCSMNYGVCILTYCVLFRVRE